MKKILVLLFLISITILLLYPRKKNSGEFEINDVSKTHFFIDSVSTDRYDNHSLVRVRITGQIDSNASIIYASFPENLGANGYTLTKGEINIFTEYDFYQGNKIWIKFEPLGSKRGKIKVETQIH